MAIKNPKGQVTVSYESEESNNEKEDTDLETEHQSESSAEDEGEIDDKGTNSGWADSISKILKTNRPKGKKTLVLSKAKKLTDLKAKPVETGYEIETHDGVIKRDHIEPTLGSEHKLEKTVHKKKKEIISVRKKPNILEKDRERTLSKIATKGVVQLFNVVKKQQKDIDSKLKDAGTLEVKRDKVLKNIDKREFLKVLRGDKQMTNNEKPKQNQISATKDTKGEEQIWSVLRDDFMMGAKMKDWDKEVEDDSVMEVEQELIVESE